MSYHDSAIFNEAHANHSKVDMDPSDDADGKNYVDGRGDDDSDGDGSRNGNAHGDGDGNGDGNEGGNADSNGDRSRMNDKLQHRVLDHEEIDAEDDTPKAGDFLELKVVETVHPDERDELGMPKQYYFFYTDADGPVISIEEEESDYDDREPSQIITRWVFVAVTHVGSNFLLLQDLHKHEYRVHLDKWQDECRKVDDADARIQQSVNYWQDHLSEATRRISQLMQSIGVEGRQLAPDTQALAVQVGAGPAEEHKSALMKTREELPVLYKQIERAGKNMGKWMGARALPMLAVSKSLEERQESIDSRLLAVDLYAGLSEEAVRCRHGQPADFREKLHLMQRMHYMDEECLVNYQHGGMDYGNIRDFDRWLAIRENFDRLLPHPRCAIAFRVRRDRKKRHGGHSWADFVRIAFEEQQDRRTFLYLRNGNQLWRVECEHDFGERLFPDLAHSTIATGEQMWAKQDGHMLQTQGSLEQRYGEDWIEQAQDDGFEPFNQSSVYFDDIQSSISKMMGEYNRVAVLLQGLLDRSPALHPHPPIRLWDAKDFDTFIKLVFDKDRALVSGPAPDFEAYKAKLSKKIEVGSFTIGQEDFWWERERERENARRANSSYYSHRETIYKDNQWWNPPSEDPGPGHIAKVVSMRGGRCRFNWMRQGRRQVAGSERWDDNYPQVKESIRIDPEDLFNVSAYEPGDYKQFFADPRTRQEYLQWAPTLLAAEEWYAQGGKFDPPITSRR